VTRAEPSGAGDRAEAAEVGPAAEPGKGGTRVIVNPGAGSIDAVEWLEERLAQHPLLEGADFVRTETRGDAARLARAAVRDGCGRLAVVGGDGTVNEAVNGVMAETDGLDARPALLVIPAGTGNDLARALDLPGDPVRALDRLHGGRRVAVDVVEMIGGEGRWFLNASAGGFSGEVDRRLEKRGKKGWGPLSYLKGALETLPEPVVYDVEIDGDGERVFDGRALNVVVANGRSVAGGLGIAPRARMDDGAVDVVVIRPAEVPALLALGSRCLVGRHLDHALVAFHRCTEVSVRSSPPMPVNADGELVTETPVRYEVAARALSLLLPSRDLEVLGEG